MGKWETAGIAVSHFLTSVSLRQGRGGNVKCECRSLANAGVTTTAGLLIYNDNEEVFSADYSFQCWRRVPVLSVSGAFADFFLRASNQNPSEVEGAPFLESGWFDIKGLTASSTQGSTENPPILGMLVDIAPVGTAELPFVDNP